jgi:elongation factor Ts
MASNIELIKKLREEMGGVGMADCKRALEESQGDYNLAKDWLRKKGISKGGGNSSRVAADGLICIINKGKEATMTEINVETDFVAANEAFQNLVLEISEKSTGNIDALKSMKLEDTTIEEAIFLATSKLGEKITLRRTIHLKVDKGIIASYLHNSVANKPHLGKTGALLAIESESSSPRLAAMGKQICMHIAAHKPKFLSREDEDPESLKREKNILTEQSQAQGAGKPANIIEKMVEGKLSKFYSDCVLLEQPFIIDPKITVKQFVETVEKEIGSSIKFTEFAIMKVGEGIEKATSNLAEEVAKLTN